MNRMTRVLAVFAVVSMTSLAVCALTVAPIAAASSCESLASLKIPDTTITTAESVAAGAFTPPGARGGRGAAQADLPAFCRVAATLKPSSDSDIKIELWVPASNWNGKRFRHPRLHPQRTGQTPVPVRVSA